MNTSYEWMKLYEAAVLETNREALPQRIEAAQNAIGQRVMTLALDELNDAPSLKPSTL